jgi:hypothetical protein
MHYPTRVWRKSLDANNLSICYTMPLISTTEFSPISAPYEGVIPQPHATNLGGETYKYASKVGGRRQHSKKHRRLTKKAKKNRRSRRTRSKRMYDYIVG